MDINTEKINSKSLVIVTCPIKGYYEYIVTGTYVGANSSSSFLNLYIFNSKDSKNPAKLLTQIPCSSKFSCLAWTPLGQDTQEHALGYVLSGHQDGTIGIWDITEILSNSNNELSQDFGLVKSTCLAESEITSIAINDKPHVFAFGSSNVSLASINANSLDISIATNCEKIGAGQICCLSWNPKVSHILACATTEGKILIYNMRNGSVFVSISDQQLIEDHQISSPNEPIHTNVIWQMEGTQVIIAYDDQEYNYLTQYHMKQPNAPSAFYQNGHSNSIIDISRNAVDTSFILTLGRDNVATCWSLKAGRPLCQINLKEKCSNALWVNKIPDCFLCVGFSGKIWVERINFVEDMTIYTEGHEMIPNWIGKPAGCAFAFGGKLYKFSRNQKSTISISKVCGNKSLVKEIQSSNKKIEKEDLNEFLDEKINISENENKTNLSIFWSALKSVYNKNPEIFYKKCGFDKNQIEDAAALALGKNRKKGGNTRQLYQPQLEETDEDVNLLFESKPVVKEESNMFESKKSEGFEKPNTIQETVELNINWNVGTEKLIKQSLITGNLNDAVELLFKLNRDSEALLLASSQPELFEQAQAKFFNKTKDLYVKSMFPSIIKNNFELLFDYNYLKDWKEYLLYAKTYLANQQDFQNFAEKLGDKLSNTPDFYCSLVCYIIAENYSKSIDIIFQNYQREGEKFGKEEKKFFLQNLFEQTQAIQRILNQNNRIHNDNYNTIIYDYCFLLIDEGLNVEASQYLLSLRGTNSTIDELYERVYYNCEYTLAQSFPKPNNPYNIVPIRKPAGGRNLNRGNMQPMGGNQPLRHAPVPQMNNPVRPQPSQPNKAPFRPNVPTAKPPNLMKPNQPMKTFTPNNPVKPPQQEQAAFNNNNFNQQPMNQNQQNEAPKRSINFGVNKGGMAPISKPPAFKPVNAPFRGGMGINKPNPISQAMPNQNKEEPQMQKQMVQPPSRGPFSHPKPPMQNNMMNKPSPMSNPMNAAPIQSNKNNEMNPSDNNAGVSPMSKDEEEVYNYFESMQNLYNQTYPDPTKQKDFGNKVQALFHKLINHEIKPDLLQLLKEFQKVNESNTKQQDFKKLQWKIQSHDWDKNKSWMPLLGRLISMKR